MLLSPCKSFGFVLVFDSRGVLPYLGLMGTRGQPGYVFRASFCLKQGILILSISFVVLIRVSILSIFVLNRRVSLLEFFEQGPAYKKEGPDPNKGSNQQ